MAEERKHNWLSKAAAVILILLALLVFTLNILYQLTYGSLSGISYRTYAIDSVNAVFVLIGAYAIYRVVYYLIIRSFGRRIDAGSADTIKTVLRVLLYMAAIAVILTTFGVSLSGALAGGAVGGVVIGLAAQTIVTNILSGFFVSSSQVIKPGDVVSMRSSAWGEITCSIVKVNMLWTYAVNQYGNAMHFPNSALLGNMVFTRLKYPDELRYLLKVVLSSDVATSKIKEHAIHDISVEFGKRKLPVPAVYIASSDGFTNTFAIALRFSKFAELNELIDVVNNSFNEAYWKAKAPPPASKT